MNIQLNPLVDFLVENISNDSAPYVRSQYDKLIAERDTSDVWRQFAIWLLIDPDHGVIRFTKPGSKQHAAIQNVARIYDENCKDRELWEAAFKDAAWSDAGAAAFDAATAAYYSAAAAYYSATAADAAAFDAATAAYYSAAAAYYSATAAEAAAFDAAANAGAWSASVSHAAAWWSEAYTRSAAAWAARAAACKHMAEKLLELLQSAPPKEAP